jgi:excisionase family DNA binding protein
MAAAGTYLTTKELADLAAEVIRQAQVQALPTKHLTLQQLADRLGIKLRTAEDWLLDGKLPPSIRIGHTRRWRLVDIEEWEESHLVRPAGT